MNEKITSKKLRVFLDANCWMASAGSPDGGSALILKLARAGHIQIIASHRILQEARHNIEKKMGEKALLRYYEELVNTDIEIIKTATLEEENQWKFCVDPKDCHVLASAYKGDADVIISLDKKHILTDAVRNNFPIPVKDTKNFLESYLSGF